MSAVAISNDDLHVCFADKFGVVWVVDLHGIDGSHESSSKKAVPLLAHYCSIITSLVSQSSDRRNPFLLLLIFMGSSGDFQDEFYLSLKVLMSI